MDLNDRARIEELTQLLQGFGLLDAAELQAVIALLEPAGPLSATVALAETVHLHIKVDNVDTLPADRIQAAGASVDHRRDGYVKFHFPGQANLICSHIDISQDDLLERTGPRRPRPFLDHLGVDLRTESAPVLAAFSALPQLASSLGWSHVPQGSPDKPVYCCHVEVAAKHWLFPRHMDDSPAIPIEFAYGALKVTTGKSGCDLRPADPLRHAATATSPCCGTAAEGQGGAEIVMARGPLARPR